MSSDRSAFDAAAARVRTLHDERAALLEQLLAAEDELIRQAAAAHRAGNLDARGLLAAYDLVRDGGITGFAARWQKIIPYDRHALRRMAEAIPNSPDGTWSGNTGWEGLDDSVFPLRGTHVVYVLFGNAGTPVRIGMTHAFRAHLKRLHRDGVVWQSWKAWPCENREDALQMRNRITAQHNKPNIATSTTHVSPGAVWPIGNKEHPALEAAVNPHDRVPTRPSAPAPFPRQQP
ncbi:hypothetical protein [Amycolatopsis nalaikhensis]|uniref:GIY-YIG nuclease family protein n=1 Tax=Amycolatopsis nalaikhensis TaxID=715472 RepID=A0ABY8XQ93_9PSEU|nr:hypothetical protein [Amycolatopsis sp. 2-2]WIV57847.1 hypothetical protein QP939_03950 [Amycolatopsis sp. 2-2]